MENKYIFVLISAAVALLFFGCVQQSALGSDRDAHGCIASAGYSWCELSQKCIRAWEEPCTAAAATGAQCTSVADCPPGAASCVNGTCSQYDEHGCVPDGGYSWCDSLQQCIQPWVTNCPLASMAIYTENFPPYNFVGTDGKVTGQSTEMVQELLKRTGQEATIELLDFSESYDLTLVGPNTALYSAARTPQREHLFKWAGPIGTWDYTFYAPAGSNQALNGIDDAKAMGVICVVQNDARHQYLLGAKFSNIETAENDAKCAQMLKAGNATLWFGSDSSYSGTMADAGLSESDFTSLLSVPAYDLYIAFNKNIPDDYVAKWQSELDAMKADGSYQAILAKYGNLLAYDAKAYCGKENIGAVYVCGEYIRTVSTLIGGGSTFYGANGTVVTTCPVLAPESMSAECRLLLLGNNCVETQVC